MKRTSLAALATIFGLTAFGPLDSTLAQDGKTELRFSFKKGDKFPLKLQYNVSVKLDKLPEILQGVLSEDLIDVKFDAALDMEVMDVTDTGSSLMSGTWQKTKAKGHVMINDIDFDHDPSKKTEDKPKKKEDEDPALQGFQDIQDQLGKMVRVPLKLSVDRYGKISLAEGSGKVGQLEGVFRSFNGLMGPLPKDKMGKGDTWKDTLRFGLPGVPGNVELVIRVENAIDSFDKVEGRDLVLIKTKFAVGKLPGDKEDPTASPLEGKIKTEGDGEGKTLFSLTDSRTSKAHSNLKIRVTANIPNPGGGGDDLELKGLVRIDMAQELGKK